MHMLLSKLKWTYNCTLYAYIIYYRAVYWYLVVDLCIPECFVVHCSVIYGCVQVQLYILYPKNNKVLLWEIRKNLSGA